MADDDKISRRYRELPREEPPRHLDEAILAAARRAVHTRPAPLVVPSGRQRWYFPLAAAAIIVLAVAVTAHMEREEPAEEMLSSNTVTAPAAAREAAPPAPAAEPAAPARAPSGPADAPSSPRRFEMRDEARSQKPAPAPSRDERANREAAPADLQKAQEPAPSQAPAPPLEAKRRMDEGARATSSLSAFAAQSPEQWLQGIADLRRQGRHAEADKELAEFRKRYADYRISAELREQVERSTR